MSREVRYNVALSGDDGSTLEVGKIVSYKHPASPLPERLIFHQYIKEIYRRRDIDALGINASLVHYIHDHCPMIVDGVPVDNLWMFDPQARVTYSTNSGLFLAYSLAGEPDIYGGNFNLPSEEFHVHQGQIKTAWAKATRTIPRTVTITKESTRTVPAPQLEPERQPSLIGAMP
jgi:hypothetical protein